MMNSSPNSPWDHLHLQICIVGWHFQLEYYQRFAGSKNVFVVAHRQHPILEEFTGTIRDNIGLEWGAYNHFLMNVWDGQSAVLFSHDDIRVMCEPKRLYEYVAQILEHQAEMVGPCYARFFLMKKSALGRILADGGFWFDADNHGNVHRNKWRVNRGVRAFRRQLKRLNIRYRRVAEDGVIQIGIRGRFFDDPSQNIVKSSVSTSSAQH